MNKTGSSNFWPEAQSSYSEGLTLDQEVAFLVVEACRLPRGANTVSEGMGQEMGRFIKRKRSIPI